MFLILFRNILCPQQMFPSLCSPRNIMGNNVSAKRKRCSPICLEKNYRKFHSNGKRSRQLMLTAGKEATSASKSEKTGKAELLLVLVLLLIIETSMFVVVD